MASLPKTMGASYPILADQANLVERLRGHAINRPNAIAFRFLGDGERETDAVTFGGLDRQACIVGQHLQTIGVTGERVLLLLPQDLRFIRAFFGCLYAGAIATPAMVPRVNRPVSALIALATDADPAVILTTREIHEYLRELFPPRFAKAVWVCIEDIMESDVGAKVLSPQPDALAFLQYTSGSTGSPKGVMVTHANLIHNMEVMRQALSVSDASVYGSWLPMYHDMGLIGVVLGPVYFGVPSILMPAISFLQKPIRWLKLISNYRVTISGGPNFGYQLCVDRISESSRSELDLSSWQIAFNGAETVRPDTIKRFSDIFHDCGFNEKAMFPCYGMAEATLFVSGGNHRNHRLMRAIDRVHLQNGRISQAENTQCAYDLVGCGGTWHQTRIEIVDPITRYRLPKDEVGEIWVENKSVARGYFNQPELSEQVFRARIANLDDQESEVEFLRTGDLGFVEDGIVYITSRLKDLIIIRGRNFYPQDIENTVESCSKHVQSGSGAAFSVEVGDEEKLVVVHELRRTSLRTDHSLTVLDIQEAITAQHGIGVYAVMLVKPGTIPKTSSGKIRRLSSRDAYLQNRLELVHGYVSRLKADHRSNGLRSRLLTTAALSEKVN